MSFTLAAASPLSHVLPHDLGPFSNHFLMGLIAAIVVAVGFTWFAKKIDPKGKSSADDFVVKGVFAQLIETLCEFIHDFVAKPQLKHLTDKYIGFIWTIFFFVLTCNLLGLIPFGYFFGLVSSLVGVDNDTSYYLQHVGGTATSNLSLNGPLALCSFVAVLYIGIKETGFKHFVGHFNPIGWDDKKLAPIGAMLFVLEWVGLVIKCVVLAFRLFGTMLAGHLVLAVLVGLIFQATDALGAGAGFGVGIGMVILSVAMFCLEIFVAFLQAFIFTFLTVLFIAMTAVTDHHPTHDGEAEHDDHGHDPSMEEVLTHPVTERVAAH